MYLNFKSYYTVIKWRLYVRHETLTAFCVQDSEIILNLNTYFLKESFALLDPCLLLWVGLLVLDRVDLEVRLGVLDLEVGLLNEMRNLLELVVSIIGVVKHDAVKDLSEMGVQVKLDSAALISGLLKLSLDALKSFQAYAHLYINLF
jgi:hypothetical protein